MCSPRSVLASAPSIHNRSFRLGELPHITRSFYYFVLVRQSVVPDMTGSLGRGFRRTRTLKTAHPDFFHLARPVSYNFPFGLTCLNLDQVLDRLVSASFYVAAFTPLTYLLVVFQGSYFFRMGYFFLRWASRLDAFSVYPLRISLPSCALGRTTVAPVMRSLRSSRTRSNSSHVSFAHDG